MRIKITKYQVGIPMVVRDTFVFDIRSKGSHSAEVVLAKDGEYILNVDGYACSPYEQSAKRSPFYKQAILNVSYEMQQAIDSYNNSYTQILKETIKPKNKEFVEKQLAGLFLKGYEREKFKLPKPQKSQVKADLQNEANSKYFSIWKRNASIKKQFIDKNLGEEFNDRLNNWEDLKEYHELIQDHFETKANAEFQREYDAEKKIIEDELYGDEAYVKQKFNELPLKCRLPFDVILGATYNKSSGIINATATLPSLISIPNIKAVPLASGKISIKEKLNKEIEQDTIDTLLGIGYNLAGHLFSLSVNVNLVRLYVMTGSSAYYWIQFDRNSFSAIPFSTINPQSDFFRHPNVIDLKKSRIGLIPENLLTIKVNDAIKVADKLLEDKNLVALSLKEAEIVYKNVENADDLKTAIKIAKENNSSTVVVNKKYKNVLDEIKKEEE